MNKKSTLKPDKEMIIQTRRCKRNNRHRLSTPDISPTVRELSGIINLDSDKNRRDEYTDYLLEKYR